MNEQEATRAMLSHYKPDPEPSKKELILPVISLLILAWVLF